MANKACGAHDELASTPTVRITRCGCGTVHLTLLGPGVTVRLNPEQTRGLLSGLKAAVERIDAPSADGTTCMN